MDLQAWLKLTNTPVKAFAGRIGVDQATVRRYMSRKRRPSLEKMWRIIEETQGAVGLESFFDEGQNTSVDGRGSAHQPHAA
jgi:transcriptional regulator with XRE-family HTH domain